MKRIKLKKIGVVISISILFIAGFRVGLLCNEESADPSKPSFELVERTLPQLPIEKEFPIQTKTKDIQLIVGDQQFKATLNDSIGATQLFDRLPITIRMSDLNHNEKYYNLSENLQTNTQSVFEIKKGDLMLYGDHCLVLFYKNFTSSYSYTRLGQIMDVEGLENALGSGYIEITWTKAESSNS